MPVVFFRAIHAIDNMVKMLEIHTVRLENIVHERSQELYEQKQRADSLLYSILPKYFNPFLTASQRIILNSRESLVITQVLQHTTVQDFVRS